MENSGDYGVVPVRMVWTISIFLMSVLKITAKRWIITNRKSSASFCNAALGEDNKS